MTFKKNSPPTLLCILLLLLLSVGAYAQLPDGQSPRGFEHCSEEALHRTQGFQSDTANIDRVCGNLQSEFLEEGKLLHDGELLRSVQLPDHLPRLQSREHHLRRLQHDLHSSEQFD